MILQQLVPTRKHTWTTNETLNFDRIRVITLGRTIKIMKSGSRRVSFGSPFLHVFIVWLFVFLNWYSSPCHADVLRVVKEGLSKPKERLRGRLVTAQRIIFQGCKCVLAAGTRDEPQSTSAWEAKCVSIFYT